jgi:hypothetical protein
MKDFLITFGGIIATISILIFIVSFFMLFIDDSRKKGLKLMLISVISFIIGFGTCVSNLNI